MTKRIIFHVGTHKTATSGFQRYCFKFNRLLSKRGVCYPTIIGFDDLNNHSLLAWSLEQSSSDFSVKILTDIFSQFKDSEHHTLLLSSEDFENSLIYSDQISKIISSGKRHGFKEFEILIATKNPYDYLVSIYSELSKQRLVLNFLEIAEASIQYGFFTASTSNFNYCFAINAIHHLQRFSSRHPDIKINHYDAQIFTTGFPGKYFLSKLIGTSCTELMQKIGLAKTQYNKRLNPLDVEINYAKNILGIKQNCPVNTDLQKILIQIAQRRLALVDSYTKEIEEELKNISVT